MSELDIDKLKESLPKSIKDAGGNECDVLAIECADSPSATLAAMAQSAPAPIRDFIEEQAMLILATELPKLYAVSQLGPQREATDIIPLATIYTKAMERLDGEEVPGRDILTATVRDAALELAEVLDKSVKRVLLDDKYANRLSLMDMASCHARLVKTLGSLALTPDQLKDVEEYVAANAA